MPEYPLTLKQERFVIEYIETGNASEAYRRAYNTENMKDETINREAHELLHNHNVSTRIEKEKARLSKKLEVTVESLTEELNEALQMAKDNKQVSAIVQAVTMKAKLHGLLIEKRQLENIGTGKAEDMTNEQLARIAESGESAQTDSKDKPVSH